MTADVFAGMGTTPAPSAPPSAPPPAAATQPARVAAAPAFPGSTPPGAPSFPGAAKPGTPDIFEGFHAPKKPPSAIALAGDYLDTPFLLAGALSRRHAGVQGYDPNPNWEEAGKVLHSLSPDKIDDVASRYNLTSPEQLADQAAQGDAFAGFLGKHPKVAMADQFVSEFANPTNVVVPRVASIVGKGVGAGVKAVPGATDAVNAVKRMASPTGGLLQEGGVQADRIGRKTTAMRNEADAEAVNRLTPIWKDTNNAERREIERRSEVDDKGAPMNPHRPVQGGKLSDAELTARAQAYRAELMKLDAEQLNAGTARGDQMMASQSYTPRYGAGYKKIYDDPHSSPEVAEYLENTTPRGSGASYRSGTLNKRKQFLTYDQAEASGMMSKDYDPANNALAHFRQRLGNIKLNNAVKEFGSTGQLAPLKYRFGDVEGEGKEGHAKVMAAVEQHAKQLAKLDASQKTGLPIMRRAKMTGSMFARAQEAARNAKNASTLAGAAGAVPGKVATKAEGALIGQLHDVQRNAQGVVSRVMRGSPEHVQMLAADALNAKVNRIGARTPKQVQQIAAPAVAIAKRMFRNDTRSAARATMLANRLAGARITAQDAATFQRAVHDALHGEDGAPGILENLKRRVTTDAERRANAEGRVTKIPQQLSSMPALQHSSVTPALADYLQKMAAAPEDAGATAKIIDTINKLARIGIISNPAVHVLWNLNNNALGAGMKPAELAALYAGRFKIDPALEAEAERNGAFVHFGKSTGGLGGLDYGKLVGSSDELSPLQKLDQGATKVWDANQTLVFDKAEKGIAATLYQTKKAQRLAQGMSEADAGAAAGIDVRKALGDYANVSREGLEKSLNKALFFYPWLKTVIPFWVQTSIEAPQWVNAPYQAIRANNAVGGDPNADKESPQAIYLGSDANGDPRYFSWPGPQKILSSLAEMAAPQGNPLGGVGDRVTAASRLAESHLNPVLGTFVDAGLTAALPASEPGGANMTTLFDKDAPLEVQLGQTAENATKNVLPLPIAVKQFADYLHTLPGRPDPLGDMAGMGASALVGGDVYQRGAPGTEKALYRLREEMHRQVSAARKAGQDDVARQIYYQYEQMMQQLTKGAR